MGNIVPISTQFIVLFGLVRKEWFVGSVESVPSWKVLMFIHSLRVVCRIVVSVLFPVRSYYKHSVVK